MKCYMSVYFADENSNVYADALRVAITSGLQNTSLEFIVLYDGPEDHPIREFLSDSGVKVIEHRFSREAFLPKAYPENSHQSTYTKDMGYRRLASTFTRFDIPFIETEDEFVLYTDVDVLFLRDIDLSVLPRPNYLAASQEWDKDAASMEYFNAGILLLNVKGMRKKCNMIFRDLEQGIPNKINVFDQGYLNQYCFDDFDYLSSDYNWKPYWGVNKGAKIVHFHGMKPGGNMANAGLCWNDSLPLRMLGGHFEDLSGIIYYSLQFFKTLGSSGDKWISDYSAYLFNSCAQQYKGREIQKVLLGAEDASLSNLKRLSYQFVKAKAKQILPAPVVGVLKKALSLKKNKCDGKPASSPIPIRENREITPLDCTVIVASYNYERFIAQTLQSLVNQTLQIPRIIVVDDGSVDRSVAIIKDFEERFDNLTLLQHSDKKNHGLSASISLALRSVDTKWVAFCESDDFWDLKHFENLSREVQEKTTKKEKLPLVVNKIVVYSKEKETIFHGYIDRTNHVLANNDGHNIFQLIKNENLIPTFSAVTVPVDILLSCNFNSFLPQYLDYWLWRQICLSRDLCFIENATTFWRRHSESCDARENVPDIKEFLAQNDKILRDLKKM